MHLEQAARSHVGCRRKINEDALLARADLGLWAVADGVGGHAAGDLASNLLVEGLAQTIAGPSVAARKDAVRVAIEDVNRRLQQMASGGSRNIATTVVALVIGEEGYACLWAGDSRAYLLRNGMLRLLTRDHSLVQQLVDSGDLSLEAAANHPNANIITRAVGSAPAIELDSVEGDVRAGDTFILASDGLTRLLPDQELAAVQQEEDLELLANRWVAITLERGAPDNLTFIILRMKQAP